MTRLLLAVCLTAAIAAPSPAQNVSPAPILQWFEADWQTMYNRTPDLFMAGYGGVWTPPPGRGIHTIGGGGIGYDVYDRFDLGAAGDETIYGTRTGYEQAVERMQQSGAAVYADFLINHASSFDWTDSDSNGVRFVDDPNNPGQTHGGGNPGFGHAFTGDLDGDFHPNPPVAPPGSEDFEYQFQLAQLYDIDHRKTHAFIRQPVTAGDPNNIPAQGNADFLLPQFDRATKTFQANPNPRRANVPMAYNRQFYPDQASFIDVTDHVPGDPNTPEAGTVRIYNFTGNEATSGVPVTENANAYLMRYARWMVQEVGVDGFRVDAARHVYPFVHDFYDRGVWAADQRTNLDGSPRHVFSFLEAFTGDKAALEVWHEKDIINPNDLSAVKSNRDVLDLPLFFALRDNLTANTGNNNWHNVRDATFDVRPGDAFHDGSDGVMFVSSHDEEGAHLNNVAHAYMLMHPGNAVVYHNARGFNNDPTEDERPFPKDGRGDALGGLYGDTITTLTNIRNTHGRGDYAERWIDDAFNPNGFSNILVYEREGSAVVALNSRVGGFGDWDGRSGVGTSFAQGTILVELTGNASNANIDSNEDTVNEIPEVIVVGAGGNVDLRIPQNHPDGGVEHNSGYVIYGLATPRGTLSVSNVSQVLAGGTPTAQNNPTNRLTDIEVIASDTFEIRLDTQAVTHVDNGVNYRDVDADGDFAIIKIDEGVELNGVNPNGTISGVDFDTPGDVKYGFEMFVTENTPGFGSATGDGMYRQSIDATALSEGMHFVTVRAFRHRSDGGPEVFTDFKKVLYIDRIAPEAAVEAVNPGLPATVAGSGPTAPQAPGDAVIRLRSTDMTADSMHALLNLHETVDQAAIDALIGINAGTTERVDLDLFDLAASGLVSGHHVVTVVTFEPTGNKNTQRFAGVYIDGIGAGLGDAEHDGDFDMADVAAFESVLYSQHNGSAVFDPASDIDGDGRVATSDLLALNGLFIGKGASQAAIDETIAARVRRADVSESGGTTGDDIDTLYANFGSSAWIYDIDGNGTTSLSDVETLLEDLLGTRRGDANLDRQVSLLDLNTLGTNFGQAAGWAGGDFNGDGQVTLLDLNALGAEFGFDNSASARALPSVPEPGAIVLLGLGALALVRRRSRIAG